MYSTYPGLIPSHTVTTLYISSCCLPSIIYISNSSKQYIAFHIIVDAEGCAEKKKREFFFPGMKADDRRKNTRIAHVFSAAKLCFTGSEQF